MLGTFLYWGGDGCFSLPQSVRVLWRPSAANLAVLMPCASQPEVSNCPFKHPPPKSRATLKESLMNRATT